MRTLGSSYILSPEQITQCDTKSDGCQGGLSENAYNYVQKQGGIEQESDYPYTSGTGRTGKCHVDTSKEVIAVKGYSTVKGEDSMASYVQSTGPLSVCVAASTWQFYTGGVVKRCGRQVDHCVQAVGVDVKGGYWKVRNSWGSDWGESGYIRLAYGENMCKITNDATYVKVEKVSN
jgi:C1A family cysteine protease